MSTIPPQHRSAVLITLAGVFAAQIPVTISQIHDPLIRGIMQVSCLILVIAVAWKAQPPKDPPIPPVKAVDIEPITIPDPPRKGGSWGLQTRGVA